MPNNFVAGRGMNAQSLTRLGAAVDGTYFFPSTAGGAVSPSSGLTIAIAAITANMVTINSALSAAYAGGTDTVAAADATNPRIDTVIQNVDGTVDIVTGTPVAVTATTGPTPPTIATTQIAIADIYVAANATSIGTNEITDRRQAIVGGVRLVASSSAATSTTSTSAVDLVTISGLNIPVDVGVRLVVNYRKQALAANAVAFGLKVNSTVTCEAAVTSGLAETSANNQAENGVFVVEIAPRSSANYLSGGIGYYVTGANGGTGAVAGPGFRYPMYTAGMPNAAITSIAIRAINNIASNAAEVTSVKVFTF